MRLFNFPDTTEELLKYLRSLPSSDPQHLLEAYTQSLNLIKDDSHSLLIFLDYISLSMNFLETDEVEHLYNLFKVKLRRFKVFWINYIRFEVEKKAKDFDAVFSKVLEYLRVKVFEGKEDLAESLIKERDMLKIQMSVGGITSSRLGCRGDTDANNCSEAKEFARMEEGLIEKDLGKDDLPTVEILSSSIFMDQTSQGAIENMPNTRSLDCKGATRLEPPGARSFPMEKATRAQTAHCESTGRSSNSIKSTETTCTSSSSSRAPGNTPGPADNTNKELEAGRQPFVTDSATLWARNGVHTVSPPSASHINMQNRKTEETAFELELSGPHSLQKLRSHPGHEPDSHTPRKATKRRFVDITSRDEIDGAFSCGLFDKTISFGQRHNTIAFKDRELTCINRIGKGGYSNVYSVFHSGELYALKQIRAEDRESLGICLDEIGLLRKLSNCEFVIRMIDYEIKGEFVNILLEYGETDLQKLIQSGPMNTFYIKYIWESILNILVFIHANRIVHRDIKPANFVLVKGKVRIIDFGISKSIRGDTTSILNFEKAGTLNYISPEQCSGGKVSRSSDVWAAGCILYHMVYRKNIHNGKNVMDVLRMMADETEIEYGDADVYAIESMKACLVYDPKKRARPEELLHFRFLRKT